VVCSIARDRAVSDQNLRETAKIAGFLRRRELTPRIAIANKEFS